MSQSVPNRSWSYLSTQELTIATSSDETKASRLNIVRLAPGDRQLELQWQYEGAERSGDIKYEIQWSALNEERNAGTLQLPGSANGTVVRNLDHAKDYRILIKVISDGTGAILAVSPIRLFRTGEVPGTVVNYIHPEDYTYNYSGRSTASPSLVHLPDGAWIASHDVFWGNGGQNVTKLFRSEDMGKTWTFLCDLYPCFWGKLFLHRERLYMLGTSTEYGSLLIGRSDDGGRTWSAPSDLLPAGSREQGGPHKAPMPVVEHQGRLWTAVEHGSWRIGGHATGVVSVPADADLLDPAQWSVTPFLKYDKGWPGTIEGGEKPSLLEGNVVITPDNRLVNLLRYHTKGGHPEYGRAILLHVDDQDPSAPLTFGSVIDFHGNMAKFTIHYDPMTGRYWSLVNRVTTANTSQRNILSLVSSADLAHWQLHQDVLNYEDNGWPEDSTKVGFQYVDWQIEGPHIRFLSRTAINGAYNYHNANYITFHTIENFRDCL
ncbi:hypothetical protein ACFQ88_06120 [Paenibacillus sp. NPDC056579]|uniref:hypothetical protein n=1 Tax=Paenibacillus sp. NPDC056579 TaxID=3345871 RepID=UPI0036BB78C5